MNRRSILLNIVFSFAAAFVAVVAHGDSTASAWRTDSVKSADGTNIVYHVAGKGAPLLIVHGGWSNAQAYKPLGELLVDQYQVLLVERRNYGVSDKGPSPHTFVKDGQDIEAVIQRIGRDCYLFGHSGGALAALHAVKGSTKGVMRLALYEPPLSLGGEALVPVAKKFRALVEAGKHEEAVLLGLTDVIGYPAEEAKKRAPIYVQHLTPALWSGAADDVDALTLLNPAASQWSRLNIPVLFLAGELSNEHPLLDSTRALKNEIQGATLIVLPGQEHSASAMAPPIVANALRKFFKP